MTTRSEFYQCYKQLCTKYKRKQSRSWSTKGCTKAWLSERCEAMKEKYEPKPELKPVPRYYETHGDYEDDDLDADPHERYMRAILVSMLPDAPRSGRLLPIS